PWGPEALARAREENKPILLSIGYAACHWCHVMAHESFEDPDIAAVMNELYVNIKVDREERPDLDIVYQHALALLGQQGGWPLTMFLTPKAEPFWGGTYFPPHASFGRPAFGDVLGSIARVHAQQPDDIKQNVSSILQALDSIAINKSGGAPDLSLNDRVAEEYLQTLDRIHGGLGDAPKFPQTANLELLWRAYKRTGRGDYAEAVTLSLDRMCQGGIYDHLGGGFSRYSVDPYWLVPHFEKMLYDNALLVDLLLLVWAETRSPLYEARIRETIEWVLRDMSTETGAFAGSLDADSEGEEGRYYVWTAGEIDDLLGDRAAAFKEAYDIRPAGNWEGKTILNRSQDPALGDAAHEALLADGRARLLAVRAGRVAPARDDKILVDWNALMIATLARAGAAFGEEKWLDAARRAFDFIDQNVTSDGRLLHSWRAGRAAHGATLDDYANMCRAALALFETTGEVRFIERVPAWLEIVERHYHDRDKGGYFFAADFVGDLIMRPKTVHDSASPTGNAVLTEVFARLYYLTGEVAYRDKAQAQVAAFSGELPQTASANPTLLNGNEFLLRASQIVICGEPGDAGVAALHRVAHGAPVLDRVVQFVAAGTDLPTGHPAHGKGPIEGKPAAYVCRGPVCSLPLVDADALAAELAAPQTAEA
ncbi:MAG: thioredoxin domain-containing protein, partial [Alphaproteobacteria bacterium]